MFFADEFVILLISGSFARLFSFFWMSCPKIWLQVKQ